jgi:hypothetical protein
MKGGNYGTPIQPARSGTSNSNRITYINYLDEEPVIQNIDTPFVLSDLQYITLHGITARNIDKYLTMNNGNHNNLEYLKIGPMRPTSAIKRFRGFRVGPNSHYNWIHHCIIFDYGIFQPRIDGDMITIGHRTGADSSHNLVEDNHFYHGGHNVMAVESYHNIIRNNYLHNDPWLNDRGYRTMAVFSWPGDTGWNLLEGNRIGFSDTTNGIQDSGNNDIWRRNMVYANDGAAFQFNTIEKRRAPCTDDNYLYQNVFFFNGHGVSGTNTNALTFRGWYGPIKGTVVKNNIFYQNKGNTYVFTNDAKLSDNTFSDNWEKEDGDPLFVDANPAKTTDPFDQNYPNFNLQSDSPCKDTGAFLTTTTNSGTNSKTIRVQDAHYFMDGWDFPSYMGVQGDLIQLEGQTQRARIINIDYNTNTIAVDTQLTWSSGTGVSLAYEGSAPDIGAFEYGGAACSCTAWQDNQCGGGTCPSTQMHQTRACTPSGCSSESLCTDDPACRTIPDTTFIGFKTPIPPVIDGNLQEFSKARKITITNSRGTRGTYSLLWDETALYIAANVADPQLNADQTSRDGSLWDDDSLEVFFDTLNDNGSARDQNDYKFFVNLWNTHTDTRHTDLTWNIDYNSRVSMNGSLNDNQDIDSGYDIEIAIPWSAWGIQKPIHGDRWGFDLSMNDQDETDTKIQTQWANSDGGDPNNPDGWGDLIFTHRADTSPDYGCVRQDELIDFVGLWKTPSTDVTMPELMEAIGLWKQGTGCNN